MFIRNIICKLNNNIQINKQNKIVNVPTISINLEAVKMPVICYMIESNKIMICVTSNQMSSRATAEFTAFPHLTFPKFRFQQVSPQGQNG